MADDKFPLRDWITASSHADDDNVTVGDNCKPPVDVATRRNLHFEELVCILLSLAEMIVRGSTNTGNKIMVAVHFNFITVNNVVISKKLSQILVEFVQCGDSIFYEEEEPGAEYIGVDGVRDDHAGCVPSLSKFWKSSTAAVAAEVSDSPIINGDAKLGLLDDNDENHMARSHHYMTFYRISNR